MVQRVLSALLSTLNVCRFVIVCLLFSLQLLLQLLPLLAYGKYNTAIRFGRTVFHVHAFALIFRIKRQIDQSF